ncbi:hypothetical protein Tco_0718945 [Tanacetum coccineum]
MSLLHNSSDLASHNVKMSVKVSSSGHLPQGQKASDNDNSGPINLHQFKSRPEVWELTDNSKQIMTVAKGYAQERGVLILKNAFAPVASLEQLDFRLPYADKQSFSQSYQWTGNGSNGATATSIPFKSQSTKTYHLKAKIENKDFPISESEAFKIMQKYEHVGQRHKISGGDVLIGDVDPTDEDGDIRMSDSAGVLVSLGGEISSGGKKSQESNIAGGKINSEDKRSLVKSSAEAGEMFLGVTGE